MNWIEESNIPYHLKVGFWSAFFGTIVGAVEVALALEGKDCWRDEYNQGICPLYWNWRRWVWKDFWSVIIGGVMGQMVQAAILYLTWRCIL